MHEEVVHSWRDRADHENAKEQGNQVTGHRPQHSLAQALQEFGVAVPALSDQKAA
jgi:hypothetical protein